MSHTKQHNHLVRRPGRPKKVASGHTAGTTTGEDSERGTVMPLPSARACSIWRPQPPTWASHPGPSETWRRRACSPASVYICRAGGSCASCSSTRPIWTG
jgi:hypothetical protein